MSDNSEVDEVFDTDEVVEPKPAKTKTPKVKTKLSEEKLAKLREQLKKGRETLKAKREAAAKGEKPATDDEPPKKKTAKKVKVVLEEPIKVVVAEPTPAPTPVPVQPTPPIKKERKPRQTSNKKNELLDVVNSLRDEIKALKQPAAQQVAATPVKQTQPTQPQAPTPPKTEPNVPPAKRFKSPFVPAHW